MIKQAQKRISHICLEKVDENNNKIKITLWNSEDFKNKNVLENLEKCVAQKSTKELVTIKFENIWMKVDEGLISQWKKDVRNVKILDGFNCSILVIVPINNVEVMSKELRIDNMVTLEIIDGDFEKKQQCVLNQCCLKIPAYSNFWEKWVKDDPE